MTDHIEALPAATGHAWTDTRPHPWRRLFGRLLDITLFATLAFLVIYGLVSVLASPETADTLVAVLDHPLLRFVGGAVLVVLAAPLTALSIAWTGGSPGKWLMGVRVQRPDGSRLSLGEAFGREFTVAFAGMALGFPLISLLTLNRGYEALDKRGEADWDADRFVVVQRSEGLLQTTLMVIGILLWAAIQAFQTFQSAIQQFGA